MVPAVVGGLMPKDQLPTIGIPSVAKSLLGGSDLKSVQVTSLVGVGVKGIDLDPLRQQWNLVVEGREPPE